MQLLKNYEVFQIPAYFNFEFYNAVVRRRSGKVENDE